MFKKNLQNWYKIIFRHHRHDTKLKSIEWLYHCHLAARQKKITSALLLKDNTESRLNLLAIFLAIVLLEMADKKLRQAILNRVVYEIDDSYRQEGVHDMVVGKRVKALTAKLYARLFRYHKVFLSGNKKNLTKLLIFYFGTAKKTHSPHLVEYFFDCQKHIKKNKTTPSLPSIK
ncbi:MAG: ubiquinol-cytochrome C chaperone family protein [Alphaproteobacteria bacterium]